MNSAQARAMVAQAIWLLHAGTYALSAVGALYAGIAFPGLAAIPLLVASVLFAAVYAKHDGQLVRRVFAAVTVQFLLALLLLGGSGSRVTVGGREMRNLPGLPSALEIPAWLVGLLLPPVVTVYAIRQIRRGELRRGSADAAS